MDVTLFPGCAVSSYAPEVTSSAVHVLERLGCHVTVPEGLGCCGQLLFNTGYVDEARPQMHALVEALEGSEAVVGLSGSCVYAIRREYPRFLMGDGDWARRLRPVSTNLFEFSEFIVDKLGITDVHARLDKRVTLHRSCHMTQLLGIVSQPEALLADVEGLELVEMEGSDRCCGFGGTFASRMPEVAGQMTREKCEHALATGADAIVGCDEACLLNIAHTLRAMHDVGEAPRVPEVLHLAQVLDHPKGA